MISVHKLAFAVKMTNGRSLNEFVETVDSFLVHGIITASGGTEMNHALL